MDQSICSKPPPTKAPPTKAPPTLGEHERINFDDLKCRGYVLKKKIEDADSSIHQLEQCQSQFQELYHGTDYQKMNRQTILLGQTICEQRRDIVMTHKSLLSDISEYQVLVIGAIDKWKKQKQLQKIGVLREVDSIDTLQECCEELYRMEVEFGNQITYLNGMYKVLKFPNDGTDTTEMQSNDHEKTLEEIRYELLENSFVIEDHPSQVMSIVPEKKGKGPASRSKKTNTNEAPTKYNTNKPFFVKLRCLISEVSFNLNPGIIKVKLWSDRNFQQDGNGNQEDETERDKGVIQSKPIKGQFGVTFENMQVTEYTRDTENALKVAEQKHVIVFQWPLTNYGIPKMCTLKSLPILLTCHASQNLEAAGNLFWHNAFCEVGQDKPPEQVPWGKVAAALDKYIENKTGRGLTANNKQYLATRALGSSDVNDESLVMWRQFNKERLTKCRFTFWKWFSAVLSLIELHLGKWWKKGMIEGFISKEQAKKWLKGVSRNHSGTFLMRFSDSLIDESQSAIVTGRVSVVWMEYNRKQNKNKVFQWDPMGVKDLQAFDLVTRLTNMVEAKGRRINLRYLYQGPNVDPLPANQVFEMGNGHARNRKDDEGKPDGYVKMLIQPLFQMRISDDDDEVVDEDEEPINSFDSSSLGSSPPGTFGGPPSNVSVLSWDGTTSGIESTMMSPGRSSTMTSPGRSSVHSEFPMSPPSYSYGMTQNDMNMADTILQDTKFPIPIPSNFDPQYINKFMPPDTTRGESISSNKRICNHTPYNNTEYKQDIVISPEVASYHPLLSNLLGSYSPVNNQTEACGRSMSPQQGLEKHEPDSSSANESDFTNLPIDLPADVCDSILSQLPVGFAETYTS